jgi:hypothetical protein
MTSLSETLSSSYWEPGTVSMRSTFSLNSTDTLRKVKRQSKKKNLSRIYLFRVLEVWKQ